MNIKKILTTNEILPYSLFDKKEGVYVCHKQLSTYEMIRKIMISLTKTEKYDPNINNLEKDILKELKTDSNKYGNYIDNNGWSPKFSDEQMNNICDYIERKFNSNSDFSI